MFLIHPPPAVVNKIKQNLLLVYFFFFFLTSNCREKPDFLFLKLTLREQLARCHSRGEPQLFLKATRTGRKDSPYFARLLYKSLCNDKVALWTDFLICFSKELPIFN